MRSSDGPPENADAKKRAAIIAVNHRCLPGIPAYRNAVTVWIEGAHAIEIIMNGFTHDGDGIPFRSAPNTVQPTNTLRKRYPLNTSIS